MTFTPATPAAKQYLELAWQELKLPATSFDHWSLDYARDVYEILRICSREVARVRLIEILNTVEVWDPDTTKQQWVQPWHPEGDKRASARR